MIIAKGLSSFEINDETLQDCSLDDFTAGIVRDLNTQRAVKWLLSFPLTDLDEISERRKQLEDITDPAVYDIFKTISRKYEEFKSIINDPHPNRLTELNTLSVEAEHCLDILNLYSYMGKTFMQFGFKSQALNDIVKHCADVSEKRDRYKITELLNRLMNIRSVESITFQAEVSCDTAQKCLDVLLDFSEDSPIHGKWKRGQIKNSGVRLNQAVNREICDIIEMLRIANQRLLMFFEGIDVDTCISRFCLEYAAKYPDGCYAELCSDCSEIMMKEGFNPVIKMTPDSICKYTFKRNFGIISINGENNSGKTSLLKCIAVYHVLSQSGFRVPAEQAELPVIHGLYSVFAKGEGERSRFEEEIIRTSEVLNNGTAGTLVILNEPFQCTNYTEAGVVLQNVIEKLRSKEMYVEVVSFLEHKYRHTNEVSMQNHCIRNE